MRNITIVLLWLAGCERDATCEDVYQAVAVRVWDCTGDADLGFGRARRLAYTYGCPVAVDERVAPPACITAIEDLACEEVDAIADDPAAWRDALPGCEAAFDGPFFFY